MDTQRLNPVNNETDPPAPTRPWWRCGGRDYSDMTWLWVIIFITSSSTTVSSSGENGAAWLVLGASAVLGLLLWWGASRNRR